MAFCGLLTRLAELNAENVWGARVVRPVLLTRLAK
jgi:hypothetical protein